MQNVLADLCVESEAATVTAMRLARAYDQAPSDSARSCSAGSRPRSASTGSASACRLHAARRSSASAAPATSRSRECRGCTAKSPLNSIWEGSGNVICLDVLRAMARTPQSVEVLMDEIEEGAAVEPRLRTYRRRA